MAMEKKGVVDSENTPPECCGGGCQSTKQLPQTKQAADALEDHPVSRLADAATDACTKKS